MFGKKQSLLHTSIYGTLAYKNFLLLPERSIFPRACRGGYLFLERAEKVGFFKKKEVKMAKTFTEKDAKAVLFHFLSTSEVTKNVGVLWTKDTETLKTGVLTRRIRTEDGKEYTVFSNGNMIDHGYVAE